MSKKSKTPPPPAAPAFEPSAIYYGDDLIGQTTKDKEQGIVTRYFPTAQEQEAKQYAQERISQILPTLGGTAPEIAEQYEGMAQDFIDSNVAAFNQQYDPLLRNLREDSMARFGTTNATPYQDRLYELEETSRAPAIADITRQGNLLKQSLFDQNMSRKLNELSALGYNLNANQQQFLSGLNAPQSASQLGNNFNLSRYTNQLNAYNQQLQNQRARTGFTSQLIGSLAGGFF